MLLSFVEMFRLYFNENANGTIRGTPGFSSEGSNTLGAELFTSTPNSPIALHIGPGIFTTNFVSFTTVQPLGNKPAKVDLLENGAVTLAIQNSSPTYQVTYVGGSAVVDNPTQPNDPVYEVTVDYAFSPLVTLTNLTWNTDADGTAANASHRGVTFTYTVTGTVPASSAFIDFYWASGPDPNDMISLAYSTGSSTPDITHVLTTPGKHGYGTGDPFQDGNDPARWGTPPANATDILAILDPYILFSFADPFWSADPNNPPGNNGQVGFPLCQARSVMFCKIQFLLPRIKVA